MMTIRFRRIAAIATLALGIGQALDSGIRQSSPVSIALVGIALSAVASALWWSSQTRVHLFAIAGGLALLVVARLVSPVPLPTLALAGWFPAALIVFLAAGARPSTRS